MNIELKILDWFQTLHTPVLDKFMTSVTKLGNAGIFWIILTVLFLLIPKMRKTGVVMAAALIIDLLLCNVLLKNFVARTRPYDVNTGSTASGCKTSRLFISVWTYSGIVCFCSCTVSRRGKEALETGTGARLSDRGIEIISVCTLSNGCPWWCGNWNHRRISWISACEGSGR